MGGAYVQAYLGRADEGVPRGAAAGRSARARDKGEDGRERLESADAATPPTAQISQNHAVQCGRHDLAANARRRRWQSSARLPSAISQISSVSKNRISATMWIHRGSLATLSYVLIGVDLREVSLCWYETA